MAGGIWDPNVSQERAGLYINFVQNAVAQTVGGARGIVAIPLTTYITTAGADEKQFYTVTTQKDAEDLFGADNVQSIVFALKAGAKEVLVYTLPAITGAVTDESRYADAKTAFEARPFNVFVYDGIVTATEQDAGLVWMKRNRDEGKHFSMVFGCVVAADDDTPATGDARSIRLMDKYAVNLINGVVIAGETKNSAEYAPYIAGLIAGTALNKAITYVPVPVDDVTRRMTNTEVKTSLTKGSLILIHDGEKVKVERGICTDKSKIRKVRAEQAIATDITKTGADSYIGKIDNNPDGQKALIAAIKAYLELLADANVVFMDSIVVQLDKQYQSVGDAVYVAVGFVEIDSMEEIYLTISVGGV